MSKLFLIAVIARARAKVLPAIVTASCLAVAPASARADVNGGSVLHPVAVSIQSRTEIVASMLNSPGRLVLEVEGRRLFPPRKLRAWLSYRPGHSQASTNPRRRRARVSPLQHAFRFGADRRTRGNAPTTQATSSGAVGLHDPPLGPTTPASCFVVLPSSERIPFNERTGRRASRAPPHFTI
jgi:hypothetical protein